MELIDRGARIRPVWEYVVWQMRSMYVSAPDQDAILLCVRAMGFVHHEDFKAETFYRTLALSSQWKALWTLYLAGFTLTEESIALAISKARSMSSDARTPMDWNLATTLMAREKYFSPEHCMPAAIHRPRSLKNICVIKIRECLPDNVIYTARQLKIPALLYRMITLENDPI